jgi:hypothetical protein
MLLKLFHKLKRKNTSKLIPKNQYYPDTKKKKNIKRCHTKKKNIDSLPWT